MARASLHQDGLWQRYHSFIPCPRWPTIGDVELLEREIGKPVVTSCQAYVWYALELAHVKEKITGFGRLMASLAN